jgi:hypothetical protein
MTVTVHRKLDLFKAFGVDTIFEVGLLSVEPTHTGRGMQTCLIAGYRLNYVSLLTTWYICSLEGHNTAWPFSCEPGSDYAVPTAAVYSVREIS